MARERSINRKIHAVTEHTSVRSFMESSMIPQGFNVINESGIPIDILCQDRGYDTTVIFLHGAIPTNYRLPITSGLGVSRDVPVNRVFITDPSLNMSPELTLGWFAGNTHQRLQPILIAIISKIIESYGSQRVVFYGTSGGGFASLYYSAHFSGSLALVVNPQTNLHKHTEPAIRRYTNSCFGIAGPNPLNRIPFDIVTNIVDLYSKPLTNTVAYMQNSTDKFHIRSHQDPFIESLHPDNDVHFLQGDTWGEGHIAPPKDFITKVLTVASSPERDLGFKTLGFNRVLGPASTISGSSELRV